jgi:hypothetical protein
MRTNPINQPMLIAMVGSVCLLMLSVSSTFAQRSSVRSAPRPHVAQAQPAAVEAHQVQEGKDQADGDEGDKPADAHPDKKADANKPPEFHFRFTPNSLSHNTNINFDQNGKINNASENMSVSFRVQFDAGNVRPIMVKNIDTTKVMTDALENLTSQSRNGEQSLFSWENQGNSNRADSREFYMSMSFTPPVKPARELLELSGTMDVVYAVGEPAEAVLKPFSDYEGKRVTFKSMPGQYLIFSRDKQRGNREYIRVEMPTAFRPYIARITFYDAGGHELSYNGWGGGNNGTTEYRSLSIPLPDKGQIRVEIYPQVKTVQVPFKVTNIPMVKPGAEKQGGEIMVELHPVAPVNAELKLQQLEPVVEQ